MACLERSSPAVKEILLKLYRAEKPIETDQHLYEFGSVKYHIRSSASEPHHAYLSISIPLLSRGVMVSHRLSHYTIQMVRETYSDVAEIVEPSEDGYHLTLRFDFTRIPRNKGLVLQLVICNPDYVKIFAKISTVQAVILSSQLKEILRNVGSQDTYQGMQKPIKLVYHPREPFFVIKQPQKLTTVFPMRFKEKSDVIIATAFFQELVDIGSKDKWAKAPPCTWSAIPPPELRGEPLEDLSTNGGFVSFDISSRHVEGKKLDKTVWSLLNFYAYVKQHVKCTRGLIRRRMRKCLENLVEVLQKTSMEEDEQINKVQGAGYKCTRKLVKLSKYKIFRRRFHSLSKRIKRIRCPLKIHGFGRFRRRWLTIPKFSSAMSYTKLE